MGGTDLSRTSDPGGRLPRRDKGTLRALVVSAWRTAPRVLRTLALWIWAVAAVSATAAIVADTQDWWRDLSFTTNLVSETISGLIALPIALLVVSRLAAYQVQEANRPRLEARVAASRVRTIDAVRALRGHVDHMEREATAATNELVRAIRVDAHSDRELGEIVLDEVNEAARALYTVMDAAEWVLFQRLIAPVRIYGAHLHDALIERDGEGESGEDAFELGRLSIELESAVANHIRIIGHGQRLFGHRPALSEPDRGRINELRDAALAYVKSIDRMLQLCAELERYATGPGPASGLTT